MVPPVPPALVEVVSVDALPVEVVPPAALLVLVLVLVLVAVLASLVAAVVAVPLPVVTSPALLPAVVLGAPPGPFVLLEVALLLPVLPGSPPEPPSSPPQPSAPSERTTKSPVVVVQPCMPVA
jgi:hypothetical protein